jgi:hypothetical protein
VLYALTMANTENSRTIAAWELDTAIRCLQLAGQHVSRFRPPPGMQGTCTVTPVSGGYEITFGDPLTGPRGWYASPADAAAVIILHQHTDRRVR